MPKSNSESRKTLNRRQALLLPASAGIGAAALLAVGAFYEAYRSANQEQAAFTSGLEKQAGALGYNAAGFRKLAAETTGLKGAMLATSQVFATKWSGSSTIGLS